MEDIVVGILAILIGGLFCFQGFLAMRFVIPVWGALVGFSLGAGLVASFADESFLASATGWIVGTVVAVLFALIAYMYYEICVVIAMASIGFTIGAGILVAFGVTWDWVIILVGVMAGALLAIAAVVVDLPTVLLVVLTSIAGAIAAVAGLMLLFGALETDDFDSAAVTERIEDSWWWYALFVAAAVFGIITQIRAIESLRGSMRSAWVEQGGRSLKSPPTSVS